jgi:hydroxymethylbilane synthase
VRPAALKGIRMASDRLRIGTRKSAMAIAQTEEIARRLKAVGTEVEIVEFETTGDIDQVGKLLPHGGKGGAFVAQIREAVLNGRLHAAMHSLKDVPGNEDTPGLVIGATLSRDPPGDVLVLRPGTSVDQLKRTRGKGFEIGTNSVRRAAYVRRLFPEIEVIHFRGAADSRVRKLDQGAKQKLPDGGAVGPADALIMARSGLERVRLTSRIAYEFSIAEMLPAVGRGSSQSNAPRAISRRAVSCQRSTTRRPTRAPTPSARCCGCSTAIVTRQSRDLRKSWARRCSSPHPCSIMRAVASSRPRVLAAQAARANSAAQWEWSCSPEALPRSSSAAGRCDRASLRGTKRRSNPESQVRLGIASLRSQLRPDNDERQPRLVGNLLG